MRREPRKADNMAGGVCQEVWTQAYGLSLASELSRPLIVGSV